MSAKFSLDGAMIPRTVRRMFDERGDPRVEGDSQTVLLNLCGRRHVVRMVNVSKSGAMVIFTGVPHIGELVSLQLIDRGAVDGQVRWVRDGRIGIQFTTPLE